MSDTTILLFFAMGVYFLSVVMFFWTLREMGRLVQSMTKTLEISRDWMEIAQDFVLAMPLRKPPSDQEPT